MDQQFKAGDWVVYRKTKQGPAPGPRARHVTASHKGDNYGYTVDKYWVVEDLLADGTVLLKTRRGKQNRLDSDDPALRKAGLLTRWMYRSRFLDIERHDSGHPSGAVTA